MIAAAKKGFQAVGYELNPWLVWYSRYRAWRDGVHQNTKFYISDLWKVGSELYKNKSEMIERFYKFASTFLKELKCCLTTRCYIGLWAKYFCWESGFYVWCSAAFVLYSSASFTNRGSLSKPGPAWIDELCGRVYFGCGGVCVQRGAQENFMAVSGRTQSLECLESFYS